jgi:hypothetical protein
MAIVKQQKEINNVTGKLAEYRDGIIKKLGPWIEFKLLCGKVERAYNDKDVLIDEKEVWPASVELPKQETIMDPDTKKPVRIGAVDRFDENDEPVFLIKRIDGDARGKFTLNANEPEGLMWINFLLLSKHNKSNKFRPKDMQEDPLFEVVDLVEESKAKALQLDEEDTARTVAKGMTKEQIKRFAASMGWDEEADQDLLKTRIREYAKDFPKLFNELIDSDDFDIKADLKMALSRSIIKFDVGSRQIQWENGDVIASLPPDGKQPIDSFGDWIKSAPKGNDIQKTIKKLLAAPKKRGTEE